MSCNLKSIFSSTNNLWTEPTHHSILDLDQPILLTSHFYKIKQQNKMDPKVYYLTRTHLHYANIETPTILRGSLLIGWTFLNLMNKEDSKSKETNDRRKEKKPEEPGKSTFSPIIERKMLPSKPSNFKKTAFQEASSPELLSPLLKKARIKLTFSPFKSMARSKYSPSKQSDLGGLDSSILSNRTNFKPKLMVIRFEQGSKFTEIGTYIPSVYSQWIEKLNGISLLKNFLQEVQILENIHNSENLRLYNGAYIGTENRFIVKAYSKNYLRQDPDFIEMLKSQIEILRELRGCNTSQLIKVYEDDTTVYLTVELIRGPTIQQGCKFETSLKESEIRCLIKDTLNTLAVLKEKGFVHRKINLESIRLRDGGTPSENNPTILIEFSEAAKTSQIKALSRKAGSIGFIAPELLGNYDASKIDFHKADLFSLGVVLYWVLSGGSPYESNNSKELFDCNKPYVIRSQNDKFLRYSEHLRSLVLSFMHQDPKMRPSVEEALTHRFFDVSQAAPSKNVFKSSVNKLMFINQLFDLRKPKEVKGKSSKLEGSLESDTKSQMQATTNKLFLKKNSHLLPEEEDPVQINLRSKSSNCGLGNMVIDSNRKLETQIENNRRQLMEGSKVNRPRTIEMKKNSMALLNSSSNSLYDMSASEVSNLFSIKKESNDHVKINLRSSQKPRFLREKKTG